MTNFILQDELKNFTEEELRSLFNKLSVKNARKLSQSFECSLIEISLQNIEQELLKRRFKPLKEPELS